MKKVVITDHSCKDLEFEKSLLDKEDCVYEIFNYNSQDEVNNAVTNADAVLIDSIHMTKEAIANLNDNATIVRFGVGYDTIDLVACNEHKINVCNVPDYGTQEVAIHALTLLLNLLRKIKQLDISIANNEWNSVKYCGELKAINEITLGLIGVGRIGTYLASYVNALGMQIIAYDPYAKQEVCEEHKIKLVELDYLWENADAISFHAPVTKETKHIFNLEVIPKLKPNVVIVNTARGELVDTNAIVSALSENKIAAAGIDVFENEPLANNHPFKKFPNVVLTPHAAWCSKSSMQKLRELSIQEIIRAIRNEPLRCPIKL